MLTLTLTNPIWVVKTRLCLKNTANVPSYRRYTGLSNGLINLFRYEGVRGLYKGYLPGLFGTSHGSIQFMVYEELKKMYCNFYHISISSKLVSMLLTLVVCVCAYIHRCIFCLCVHFISRFYFTQGPFEYIFMAATSKLVAASATYPYQVVRARLQVSHPGSSVIPRCHLCKGERSGGF